METDRIKEHAGISGLSEQEVQQRMEQGLDNRADVSSGKTVGEIVRSNLLTYFNLIFLIIAILLCLVGSYRNLTFLPIVIGNTLIGIFQELRAKQVLDRMNILNAPHALVSRNGVLQKISSEKLVRDDVIQLNAGDQICADAVVLQGNIQVKESLLTVVFALAAESLFRYLSLAVEAAGRWLDRREQKPSQQSSPSVPSSRP